MSVSWLPRPLTLWSGLMTLIAFGLMGFVFYKAWMMVDMAWDTWAYHLPFAARLWGLADETVFEFGYQINNRFIGFPLLAEWLQGALWALTGRFQSTNLLAPLSLTVLFIYCRYVLKIPYALSIFGLLSVPMIFIHSTASYIDCFANAMATMMVLSVGQLFMVKPPIKPAWLIGIAILCAAAAANSKYQMLPVVLVSMLILSMHILVTQWRCKQSYGQFGRWLLGLFVPVAVLSGGFIGFTLIKNFVMYYHIASANPFFPISVALPGFYIQGVEPIKVLRSPLFWHAPNWLLWFCSFFDCFRETYWQIDQFCPDYHAPGFLMGGFFGSYVMFHVILWLVGIFVHRNRVGLIAFATMVLLCLVVANQPQSHEMRYTMVTIMTLVSLNLWMWLVQPWPQICWPGFSKRWVQPLFMSLLLGWFIVMVSVSRYDLFAFDTKFVTERSPISFNLFKRKALDSRHVLETAHDDDQWVVCFRMFAMPYAFAYSSIFHSQVQEPYKIQQESCMLEDVFVDSQQIEQWQHDESPLSSTNG